MQDQSVSNCGQGHPCRARKDVSPTDSGNSNISQGKHVPVVRGLKSPGARQFNGAPQFGPGRAADLESLIGSGRGFKSLGI
jgi:hypothetical protein